MRKFIVARIVPIAYGHCGEVAFAGAGSLLKCQSGQGIKRGGIDASHSVRPGVERQPIESGHGGAGQMGCQRLDTKHRDTGRLTGKHLHHRRLHREVTRRTATFDTHHRLAKQRQIIGQHAGRVQLQGEEVALAGHDQRINVRPLQIGVGQCRLEGLSGPVAPGRAVLASVERRHCTASNYDWVHLALPCDSNCPKTAKPSAARFTANSDAISP